MSTANVVSEPVSRTLTLLPRVTPSVTAAPPARQSLLRGLPVVIDALAASTAGLVMSAPFHPAAMAAVWVLLVAATRGYEQTLGGSRTEQLRRLGRAGVGLLLAGASASWLLGLATASGELLALVAAVTVTSVAGHSALATVASRHHSRRGGVRHGVVMVGHHQQVAEAIAEFRRGPNRGIDVVGACLHGKKRSLELPVPTVAGLDDVAGAARAFGARAVVVLPCKHLDALALRRMAWQLEGDNTQLFVVPSLPDVTPDRATVTAVASIPMVHLRRAELTGWRRVVKDVGERAVAALVLLLAAPVLLALMLAIRLDSPGSPLFRQQRVGRDDRPFTMLKLRTMSVSAHDRCAALAGANEADGVLFKIREDPRVTRLGRVLRRYSLDELPQLVNVVRGDMALVGPRPPLPEEVERYHDDVRRRLVVKPGLTGLWQVSGRSDLSWDESVRLDLRYVDNWSLGLDAVIMLRTVRAVLSHQGAY